MGATKGATSADVFGKASVAPPDVDLLAALALSPTTTPNMLRATATRMPRLDADLCRRSHWKRLSSLPPLNRGRSPPLGALRPSRRRAIERDVRRLIDDREDQRRVHLDAPRAAWIARPTLT